MEPNLIYVKTTAGENAIQERTRVIQRNVRMVLILVDGHSSVADLIRKIGNPQLTENALAELEKAGFIELNDDSLLAEGREVAQLIQQSSAAKPPPRADQEKHPEFRRIEPSLHAPDMSQNRMPNLQISFPPLDEKDDIETMASRFSIPPELEMLEKHGSSARKPHREREPMREDAPAVEKPSLLMKLKSSMQAGAGRARDDKPRKSRPVRIAAKGTTSWAAWLFFGLMGLAALVCATIFLFPFNSFIPDVEAAFASAIGRPVAIREMRAHVYPEPGLILSDVELGQGGDTIRIREIKLQPDPGTLFSEQKAFRRVVIDGTELRIERVAGISAIFASLSAPDKAPKIGAILLRNTSLLFNRITLRDMDAEIRRDPSGAMQSLVAQSADRNLTLTAEPDAAGLNLTVEAFSWLIGGEEEEEVVADSLNLTSRLEKDLLTISSLEVRVFDGLIKGNALVRAGGAMPNLTGTVSFERINPARLGEAVGIGARRLTGNIAGALQFTANSETWSSIFSEIEGEGTFTIQRGGFQGIDLAEAARRVSDTPVQGGMTSFEQMSGRMRLAPGRNQFYDLSIASGLMQSQGSVDVAKGGRLSGRLELRMKGSANQARMPVMVSGTLASPTVQAAGRQ
jgi:hypothetical protein